MYVPFNEDEQQHLKRTLDFITREPNCFNRATASGHVTGSAWIISNDYYFVLLTHHTKLNKWFQLGGHSDGCSNTHEVALREATEESGIKGLALVTEDIFGIDVHSIPKRGAELMHNHYDIVYLIKSDMSMLTKKSSESKELKWVKIDDVYSYTNDPFIARLVEKTKNLHIENNTSVQKNKDRYQTISI